jgi:peptidoglycan biosynthesis protein MviN/MurJ (putative lipid II flippase)
VVREALFAAIFGTQKFADAYVLAFRIPNLLRDLFAEGALSSAFVPVFTRYLTTRGKADAVRLANLVESLVSGVAVPAWRRIGNHAQIPAGKRVATRGALAYGEPIRHGL